jgi:hypothetical protein
MKLILLIDTLSQPSTGHQPLNTLLIQIKAALLKFLLAAQAFYPNHSLTIR